jgi:uridylate kinase
MTPSQPAYRRALLKLSGEALMGEREFGFEPAVLNRVAAEVAELHALGVQLGLVIGGGNIFRGAGLEQAGVGRVTGDHMGMLATVMNALAMADALRQHGLQTICYSALGALPLAPAYSSQAANDDLHAGRVVIMAGGTGNPYFTTDSAAALRAVEIGADLLIKATKVDGVYSADPVTHPDARLYERLSYSRALTERLGVMDSTALVLCQEHRMPLRVLNMFEAGALRRLFLGEAVGTLVSNGEDA